MSTPEKPRKVLVLLIGEVLEDPRVYKTCMSLRDFGADVTVGCTNPSGRSVRENHKGITIIRFPPRTEFFIKRLYNRLQGGVNPVIRQVLSRVHEEVPKSSLKSALRNIVLSLNYSHYIRSCLKINRMMVKTFSGESFDLVHCNDMDTLTAGNHLRSSGAAREMLYDSHEYWPGVGVHGSAQNDAIRKFEGKGIENADFVVTVNPFIADMIQETHGLKTQPSVVMNCPHIYKGQVMVDRVHSPVRVLYQGKVQAFRGLDELVLAFKHINKAELTISGYGPTLERLELLASTEGLSEKVHFTGRYEPDEALSIVAEYDIGILPYIPVTQNNKYSSPNKLFDYSPSSSFCNYVIVVTCFS